MDPFNLLTNYITDIVKTEKVREDFIHIWEYLFSIARTELTAYKLYDLPIKSNPQIILTMTSCKRLSLFQQTINSMLNTWKDIPLVDQFIVVDDNSSEDERQIMTDNYKFVKFIMKNIDQKGHLESMNIIFNILDRDRPMYWIHIEDDFLFFKELDYITMGINGLTSLQHFNVKQIMFNRNYVETFNQINMTGHITYSDNNYSLHDYKPKGYQCQYWPYFSFRPSIIDVNTILTLGNFTTSKTFFEMEYANKWTTAGYKTGFINYITNIHIGKLCNTIGENAYSLNNVPQFNSNIKNYNIKVINLANRTDRLQNITEKLKNENLSFQRYEAVDGKNLTLNSEILQLFKDNDFGYRRGVIGCALSHYYLWKQLLESNDNYYVVIEDDASFCKNFSNKLDQIVKQCYNLVFMGYHTREVNKNMEESETLSTQKLRTDIFIGGTHCYYITKEAAGSLIDFIEINGIKHGIDYLMVKVQKIITVYETVPLISFAKWVDVKDSNTDSDIQHDYSQPSLNVSNKYIFLEGLDQIGQDCFIAERDFPKTDYEMLADSIDNCIGFNTLGYFKSDIKNLTKSPYYSSSDGIYINSEYYFNVFKKKD